MQDEELDKIIREAASQHHPPYDDNAWEKMEKLLDQHLPQQKDRKRPAYFLLLFLLLCSGVLFYTLIYPGINRRTGDGTVAKAGPVENKNTNTGIQPITTSDNTNTPVITTGKESVIATGSPNTTATATAPVTDAPVNTGTTVGQNKNGQPVRKANDPAIVAAISPNGSDNDAKLVSPARQTVLSKKGKAKIRITTAAPVSDRNDAIAGNNNRNADKIKAKSRKNNNKPATTTTAVTAAAEDAVEDGSTLTVAPPARQLPENAKATTAITGAPGEEKKEKDSVATAKKETPGKKNDPAVVAASAKKDKKKNGFANNFGITVSAGTDMSFVDAKNPGKATAIYGIGLSYAPHKRILVRTGFYASQKIYSAEPGQYNGVTYPYLVGVDGDCKVYEIPVSVSYNFGQRKNHNWFGSVGLSSMLMKKEDYIYNYKDPFGYTYAYDYKIENENKHYFSVLNLSAGYQYNAGNRISFMAEPFVKLPLSGVGEGKIKLKSAGLLLTATIRPFAKKK